MTTETTLEDAVRGLMRQEAGNVMRGDVAVPVEAAVKVAMQVVTQVVDGAAETAVEQSSFKMTNIQRIQLICHITAVSPRGTIEEAMRLVTEVERLVEEVRNV